MRKQGLNPWAARVMAELIAKEDAEAAAQRALPFHSRESKDRDALRAIHNSWLAEFGDRRLRASDIPPEGPTGQLLLEATGKLGWSPKSVGRWLRRHKSLIDPETNRRFESRGRIRGVIWWALE